MAVKTYREIYDEAIASGLIDDAALRDINPDQVLAPQFFPWDLQDRPVQYAVPLDDDIIAQVLQLTLKDDAVVIHAQRGDSFERDSFQPFLEATKNLEDEARRKKLAYIYRRGGPYDAGHYYALTIDGATAKLTNPLRNSPDSGEVEIYQREAQGMLQVPPQITLTDNDDPERFKQIGNNGCNFSAVINAIIQVHKDSLAAGKLDSVLKFLFRTNVSDNPAIVALSDFVSRNAIDNTANLQQFLTLADAVYAIPADVRDSEDKRPQEQLAVEIQKKFVILSQIYKNINGIEAIATRDDATSKQQRFIDLARARKDKNPGFVAFQQRMQQIAFAKEKHAILGAQMALLPDTAGSFKLQPPLQIKGENGELLRLIDDFIAKSPHGDRVDSALLNDFFQQKKAEINRILKIDSKTEIKIAVDAVDLAQRAAKKDSRPVLPLDPLLPALEGLDQEEARQRANRAYEYTDHDIRLVNLARNFAKRQGYVAMPNSLESRGLLRASGILMRKQDAEVEDVNALGAERFVRNSRGGIVVECQAMSLTGEEAGLTATYLEHAIADILALERRNIRGLNVYPAKIIFPFNPSQGHWIVGEIILKKNERGEFSAEISQYNPMRNYSDPIDGGFCTEFSRVFRDTAWALTQRDVNVVIERPAAVRIGRRGEDGNLVTIQRGGVACGVYSAYAFDRLKEGDASKMWEGFPYDGPDAMRQRIADAHNVRALVNAEEVSVENYNNFGYRPVSRSALATPSAALKEAKLITAGLQSPKVPSVAAKTPKVNPKAIVGKITHPKTPADATAAAQIAALDKFIAENLADKDLLTAALLSLTGDNNDAPVHFVMAANLIAAGARITEEMLDAKSPKGLLARGAAGVKRAVIGDSLRDSMQYQLRNEYFLQALQSKSPDEINQLLQKYDIDLQYRASRDGSSSLHYAAQNSNPAVINLMMSQAGADINAIDHHGHSPLMIAAVCGNVETARALISHDADINVRDGQNVTALDLAESMMGVADDPSNYGEIAHLIIEKGKSEARKGKSETRDDAFSADDSTDTVSPKELMSNLLYNIIDICDGALISEEGAARRVAEISRTLGAAEGKAIAARIKYYKALVAAGLPAVPPQTLLRVRFVAEQMQNFISGNIVDVGGEAHRQHLEELRQLVEAFQPLATDHDDENALLEAITRIANSQDYPLEIEEEPAFKPIPARGKAVPKRDIPPELVSSLPFVKRKKTADSDPAKIPDDLVDSSDLYSQALRIKHEHESNRQEIVNNEPRNKVTQKIMRIAPRNKFSMDRSDFFLPEEIKRSRTAKTQLPHVLITAADLSFQPCADDEVYKMKSREDEDDEDNDIKFESSESSTYTKLAGGYKDILRPQSSIEAFQPYFANFGAMYFKEYGDGNKIFNNACLFAANSRNCVFDGVDFSGIPADIFPTMNFNKCSFIGVDFSKMPVKTLIYMKIFDDKFDNCSFHNCKFPKGIAIKNDFEFVVSKEIAAEVEYVKEIMAPIKAEMEKIKEMEVIFNAEKEGMTSEDRSLAIKERLQRIGEVRGKLDNIVEIFIAEEKLPETKISSRRGSGEPLRPRTTEIEAY